MSLSSIGQVKQQTTSSSSEQPAAPAQNSSSSPVAHIAQLEAGGSAITLETSEPLFDLAVALNVCGYDADLATSNPIRLKIRQEVNDAVATSEPARESRDALCGYIRQHTLADPGLNIAQYVSLALYVTPTPELTPSVGETEMPPDSTQVVNILPLLRSFSQAIQLHLIWIEHRPEYEALVNEIHDPLTRMILNTNIYLHQPVSSYDGRRFLVLLEPMLAPSATNARIYANDYVVVTSPTSGEHPSVHMDEIRHTYLHYEVEPLVYARAAAMDRLLPLLKPVQNSPLDFAHKSDIVALLTECLIKAVEARTMDVGLLKPKRPDTVKSRADMEHFDAEMSTYDRQAEVVRRKTVDLDMRQGWVLVEYFYGKLEQMEKDSISLKEDIGEMVYGMDVERERHHDEQIAFLPEGSGDVVRRAPIKPTGLRLAELKMLQGDPDGAEELAEKVLADPNGDHAEANYVLARVELMQREPEEAIVHFSETLKTSKNPRTLAWSHIYMGRLYDIQSDRPKAMQEYKAALATRDSMPDTKQAAETGLKQPFALPKREAMPNSVPDDTPFDPSGKAEKDAYRPDSPAKPQPQ
nr:tetratricopeptide repeat protein [Granulicella arctica]